MAKRRARGGIKKKARKKRTKISKRIRRKGGKRYD